MRYLVRGICSWLGALLFVVLAACATQENTVRAGGKRHQSVVDRQASSLQAKIALLLEKKQYRAALEAMASYSRYNQPSRGMEREFVAAINGLVETAEDALARNDYLCAGQSLRWALAAYPADKGLRHKIRSGARRMRIGLESSAAKLMDQGMQEYRQGALDRAIRIWQGILTFDDGNGEARKAIETATIQKKSLRAMEN